MTDKTLENRILHTLLYNDKINFTRLMLKVNSNNSLLSPKLREMQDSGLVSISLKYGRIYTRITRPGIDKFLKLYKDGQII